MNSYSAFEKGSSPSGQQIGPNSVFDTYPDLSLQSAPKECFGLKSTAESKSGKTLDNGRVSGAEIFVRSPFSPQQLSACVNPNTLDDLPVGSGWCRRRRAGRRSLRPASTVRFVASPRVLRQL